MSNMSNYPNGFVNGITIRGVPLTVLHPGKVFYVNNSSVLASTDDGVAGADSPASGTYQRPFASLDFAIGQCVSNRGDIIALMPGHAETYSTATATADELELDVAGVAVIGLGSGSLMPTFTFDTANTVTVPVSADNITVYNCRFVSNFLSNAKMFTLTTAKFFSLVNNHFSDTSAALNVVNIVESTGAANTVDGMHIEGNRASMLGTTFNCFAVLAATARGLAFINNHVYSIDNAASKPALLDVTGIVTDIFMARNIVAVKGTTNINIMMKCTGTTSTGFFDQNVSHSLDTTGVQYTIAAGFRSSRSEHGGAVATQSNVHDPLPEA
jgi:hypothetical protein